MVLKSEIRAGGNVCGQYRKLYINLQADNLNNSSSGRMEECSEIFVVAVRLGNCKYALSALRCIT